MKRISNFFSPLCAPRVPAALAAALLLAACAQDSLTGSAPPDVQAHLDTASHRDSGVDSVVAKADPGIPDSIPAVDSIHARVPSDTTASNEAADSNAVTEPKDIKEPEAPIAEAKPEVPSVEAKPDAPAVVPDPSASAKALEGTWKRVAHSITPGISVDGVLVTDLLMQDEASSRDNLTEFKAGGVWTEDEGATKANQQNEQSENGAWVVNADGSTISLYPAGTPKDGEHFEFKVLEVSPKTLKVSAASGAYSDQLPHSETITFARLQSP